MSFGVRETRANDPVYFGVVRLEGAESRIEGCRPGGAVREERVVDLTSVLMPRRDDRVVRIIMPHGRIDKAAGDAAENDVVLESQDSLWDEMEVSAQALKVFIMLRRIGGVLGYGDSFQGGVGDGGVAVVFHDE